MEKRMRLKQSPDVSRGFVVINENIAEDLKLTTGKVLEIVVSKKKFQFKLKIDKKIGDGVFLSKDDMVEKGLMDNTIATVREARI